jgi:hypothetical protein
MVPKSESLVTKKISSITNKNGYIISLIRDDILKGSPVHGALDGNTFSELIYGGEGNRQIIFRSCEMSDGRMMVQSFDLAKGSKNKIIDNLISKITNGSFQAIAANDNSDYGRIAIVFSRGGENFIIVERYCS